MAQKKMTTINDLNKERKASDVKIHSFKIVSKWIEFDNLHPEGILCPRCKENKLLKLSPNPHSNKSKFEEIKCLKCRTGQLIKDGSVKEVILRIEWNDGNCTHLQK